MWGQLHRRNARTTLRVGTGGTMADIWHSIWRHKNVWLLPVLLVLALLAGAFLLAGEQVNPFSYRAL
jgi:hypothetical protein